MVNCVNCKKLISDELHRSKIYSARDNEKLCDPCHVEETNLIEQEGTNSPLLSDEIMVRLEHYRSL